LLKPIRIVAAEGGNHFYDNAVYQACGMAQYHDSMEIVLVHCAAVARQLGLNAMGAEIEPAGKAAVRKLRAEGKHVAMTGAGINLLLARD
jgi:hypothetical protein